MKIFKDADEELDDREKKLKKFVEDYNADKPHTLRDSLQHELLRQIMDGERECTAWATDHENGDVFVCFSFTDNAEEQRR